MRVIKKDNNFNAINRLLKIQLFLSFMLFQKETIQKKSFFQSRFKLDTNYKRKRDFSQKNEQFFNSGVFSNYKQLIEDIDKLIQKS
jgi:hypothetical protein